MDKNNKNHHNKKNMKNQKEYDKYSLGRSRLHPEWYKYVIFTEEIKEEIRLVLNEPSGNEYLKGEKEDYQEIKYTLHGLDIVQYINLKTGHHVYECEGHFFWEIYDNIHKSIDNFPIYSFELKMALWDSWKPFKKTKNNEIIFYPKKKDLTQKIKIFLRDKYNLRFPIGLPPIF